MINSWSVVNGKKLRNGFTTGSCAAAAAGAATKALLTGEKADFFTLDTPSGTVLSLKIEDCIIGEKTVQCSVIKDSGDDPDVTNGIKIWAEVSETCSGITIEGGVGIGRITRGGLACKIGEAAINPAPKKTILETVKKTAESSGYMGGLIVTISAENGEAIAERTFNPRLGIKGGISILGTTGIVEPMSSKALIDTIRLEIDAKAAAGVKYLLICLGNYSRDFASAEYGLDFDAGVKCSNFIGEALDYAAYKNMENILVIGHSGKLCKLAGGVMDTHSKTADCRQEIFACHAAIAGASRETVTKIAEAATTDEIDDILINCDLKEMVWKGIMKKIGYHVSNRLKWTSASVEFIVFTNKSGAIKKTPRADYFAQKIKDGI